MSSNSQYGHRCDNSSSIESSDANKKSWYTIGVSENIIEASFRALIDSVEFQLMKEQVKV